MQKFLSTIAAGAISLSLISPAMARKAMHVPQNAPAAEKVRTLKKAKVMLEKMDGAKPKTGNSGRQLGRAMNSLCKTKRALERADCAHQYNKNKNVGRRVKYMRPKPPAPVSSSGTSSAGTTSSSTSSQGSSSSAAPGDF
ncbi:hypothetical protein A2706_01830 [Candidatus Peribacteria bacterium RIFCSPHIGHO2_01_FULL_51_35]|nr:MAG: hypothetical protein A2706_01830 [Candidatus Peribacteria bacterium RIFCSPHIGHO2_01_FULL_51_35]